MGTLQWRVGPKRGAFDVSSLWRQCRWSYIRLAALADRLLSIRGLAKLTKRLLRREKTRLKTGGPPARHIVRNGTLNLAFFGGTDRAVILRHIVW